MSIPNQLNQQNESPSQVPVLFIEDRKGQRTISLTKSIYSIGRGSENSIVLHSSLVSRNHAILLKVTNSEHNSSLFHIIDGDLQGNQSTNGLIINGKR